MEDSPLVVGDWPLVGRDAEIQQIRDLVQRRSGVLLAGPAGVGKSRLARVAAEHAEELGQVVVRVAASRPAAAIPLGAMAALLPLHATGDGATALTQARAALEAQAPGRSLLLLVDDAQWLDPSSAVLVHQLASNGTATVVASLRTGGAVPDPVVALWKDALVVRIEVSPLTRERVRSLLQVALGGHVESATVARLHEASSGNVLYLRELVAAAQASRVLQRRGGLWQLDGDLPVSERIAELVELRLGGIDDAERAALELIALGEPLGLEIVDELAALGAIERLEQRGLVQVAKQGSRLGLRTAHPLYGEVVRASIPEMRRRRLYRSLADTVERVGLRHASDRLLVAQWRLEAGAAADPEVLVAASRQALFAHDYDLAVRLARAAWEAGPAFASAHALADSLYEVGAYAEREEFLADLAAGATSEFEVAVIAMARSTGLFWGLDDAVRSDQVLLDAEAALTDKDWLAEVRATRATLNSQAGRHRQALSVLDALPPDTGDRALVQKALAAAFSLPAVGRAGEALQVIDEAIEAHRRLGRQPTLYQERLLHGARGMALAALGRLADAEELLVSALDAAIDDHDVSATGFIACALGWVSVNQGRLADAVLQYREAAAAFEEMAHRGPRRWALGGALLAAALAGDEDTVTQAKLDLRAAGSHPAQLFEATIERGWAWAAVAEGDPQQARDLLSRVAEAAA
ncbi:MAG TPA: AAA family ATPase, partial [Acidimicrobiales bacterium]